MKFADIEKRFSEIVGEYVAAGYTMSTQTSRFLGSEKAVVDFYDGDKILRVAIVRHYGINGYVCRGLSVVVLRTTATNSAYGHWHPDTNDMETIREEHFYRISDESADDTQAYYGTEEDRRAAVETRSMRNYIRYRVMGTDLMYARDNYRITSGHCSSCAALDVAKRLLKKRGVKRISSSEIGINKNEEGYYVLYRGKRYWFE